MCILEPSAGIGNLVQAVMDIGSEYDHEFDFKIIERHYSLVEILKQKFDKYQGYGINQDCFLDYSDVIKHRKFERIIMNPPFSNVRKHMAAAIDLMGEGSVLIALVPVTYKHPEAETLENLGPDTFASAKVHTKIIRIVM